MVAQYVVAAPKVENINFGWLSSGKLVAPKEDNIHLFVSINIIQQQLFYHITLSAAWQAVPPLPYSVQNTLQSLQ